jgi:hypothetical protein
MLSGKTIPLKIQKAAYQRDFREVFAPKANWKIQQYYDSELKRKFESSQPKKQESAPKN